MGLFRYEANGDPTNSLSADTQEQSQDTRNIKDSDTKQGGGTPQSTGLAGSGSRKKPGRSTLRRNSTQVRKSTSGECRCADAVMRYVVICTQL